MSHDDFDFEPIRGLPALLPEGERLLWQGAPNWRSLAVRAYHVRKVAIYFGLLVLIRFAMGLSDGSTTASLVLSCVFIAVLGGVAIGVLALLAYLSARSAVYSITSRRVLLRHGVAVPMTINIPFKYIEAVGLKTFADGTGDLDLTLPRSERVGYMITWPHLRPGKLTRPQPNFRALDDAHTAADTLARALAAETERPVAAEAQPTAQSASALPGAAVSSFEVARRAVATA